MKRTTVLLACVMFVSGAFICGDLFAQRSVNTANEAARAAKESLMKGSGGSSSQIEWLNDVISVINTGEPAAKDNPASRQKE